MVDNGPVLCLCPISRRALREGWETKKFYLGIILLWPAYRLREVELRLPANAISLYDSLAGNLKILDSYCNPNFTLANKTNCLTQVTIYCIENSCQIVGAEIDTDSISPLQATPPVPQLRTQRATYSKSFRLKH